MRCINLVYEFVFLFGLLAVLAEGAANNVTLPSCILQCTPNNVHDSTCLPDANGAISCECRYTVLVEPQVQQCVSTACTTQELFATLNTTSIVCDDPVRSKAVTYRTVTAVFYSLAVVSVVMKYTTHFTVGRSNWLDVSNLALAMLANTVLAAACIKMSYLGLGQDIWKVPAQNVTPTLLYFWLSEIVYFTAIGLVKISFLIFFLQIFPQRSFRTAVWICIALNLGLTIACALAAAFICTPISFAWTRIEGGHEGHCANNNNLAFTHAGMGILMDFATLALPVTQIWGLQMSTKKKLGVSLMFGVGAFVTVVSILRLRSLVHFAKTTNMTWDSLEASLWSVIEVEVGVICACLPSIRLGLARLFPKIMGSSNQSTKPTHAGGRSGRDTLGTSNWSTPNGIAVHTSVRVSHAMKPQTNDEGSFVQLVEIDGDNKRSDAGSK